MKFASANLNIPRNESREGRAALTFGIKMHAAWLATLVGGVGSLRKGLEPNSRRGARAQRHRVTVDGVPTMRPLWYEFPADAACYDVDDQFLLGPDILVAPVTQQGATSRSVVFPAGATWASVWNASDAVVGGVTVVVPAPLEVIPAYWRT